MSDAGEPVKFGHRLHELLDQNGLSQAQLAERANVDRSTISRLIKGERTPAVETLQSLAAVFKLDIGQLVQGTDAAAKLTESVNMIRRQDYDAVVQKMVEYHDKVNDLERRLRADEEALKKGYGDRSRVGTELCAVQFKLESALRDLEVERQRSVEQTQDLRRYRGALQRAVADVSSLRGQLEEVAQELRGATKSSRTTAILAGVAAVAGVVTMATYLMSEDAKKPKDTEEPR